nr:hypothetical protein [Tanacetum cinerariifolium]
MGRSCTKSSEEMNSFTIKSKSLVLPWGRTPRLDSGMRRAIDITRLRFRYLSYSYVLRDYLFFRDVPLPLLDMDIFAFIHTPNPTKVKVVKRERKDNEPRLLENTVGRIVPLLPVAPDRDESELDAIQGVKRKGKPRLLKVGGSSPPPKKLREDHGTLSGPLIAGKSRSTVQRLLAGAVLNAEVRCDPILTLPFVTSSVSATLEREGEDHTNSVTGPNLRTVSTSQRFVISSDSSRHSGANVAEADSLVRFSVSMMTTVTTTTLTADPAVIMKEKSVKPSMFAVDSSFVGGADLDAGVFSDLTGSDFIVSGICTVISPGTDLQKRRRLESVVEEKNQLLKARDKEIENLKAYMLLKEVEAAKAIHLCAEASNFKVVEKSL